MFDPFCFDILSENLSSNVDPLDLKSFKTTIYVVLCCCAFESLLTPGDSLDLRFSGGLPLPQG